MHAFGVLGDPEGCGAIVDALLMVEIRKAAHQRVEPKKNKHC